MSAIYSAVIKSVDKFVPQRLVPLWNHAAGIYTKSFDSIRISHLLEVLLILIGGPEPQWNLHNPMALL